MSSLYEVIFRRFARQYAANVKRELESIRSASANEVSQVRSELATEIEKLERDAVAAKQELAQELDHLRLEIEHLHMIKRDTPHYHGSRPERTV